MELLRKSQLEAQVLPGRIIRKAVGADGPIKSRKMTVGFAHYCSQAGPMEPHHHAEETVYILRAHKGYLRRGEAMDSLEGRIPLEAGMLIRFESLEWHVFEYDEGGEVEIVFIYGQVDNIRPEEILADSM